MMDMDYIKVVCGKFQKDHPYLRYGQVIFNYVYSLYPEVANKIRGSEYDCFYEDEKVDFFLELVKKIKEELEK